METINFTIKKWQPCIDDPFYNCDRVYPTQQRKVRTLIDILSRHDCISRIYVFGSSVTPRCRIDSDVDIYAQTDGTCHARDLIDKALPFLYDIWDNLTVDKRLKQEILSKGVLVYERNK